MQKVFNASVQLAVAITLLWVSTGLGDDPKDHPDETLPAAAEAAGESQPQVLFLHTEFGPYPKGPWSSRLRILDRELIRQAVLLTAREELGVSTCDETLRWPKIDGYRTG